MNSQNKFTAGLVQMSSGNQRDDNMAAAETLIRAAAAQGADMVVTPEMTPLLESSRAALLDKIYPPESDPSLPVFKALARELGIWLVIGSMALKDRDGVVNRSFVLSPAGEIAASYDKIYMFDVTLPGGESHRESQLYVPGTRAVVTQTPWGPMGLSICYDVRFPGLYRTLAQAGSRFLTVPAAFTRETGAAHWHVLLRARAIENGAFILAPNQCGEHVNAQGKTRQTYGHSLLVDPWGNIMDDGGDDSGVIVAEIDLSLSKKARAHIPSLQHDRIFKIKDE